MNNILTSVALFLIFISTFSALQMSKQKAKIKNSPNTKKELVVEITDEITVNVPEQDIEIDTEKEEITSIKSTDENSNKSSNKKNSNSKEKTKETSQKETNNKQASKIIKKHIPATSYIVRGKRYYTISSKQAENFTQTGTASWYGPGFHGKKTANGEIYNQNALTGAHKTLPLNTKVLVTNLETNKSITIRINDRGPYHGNRILDLSKKAANLLGVLKNGTAKIKLQVIS